MSFDPINIISSETGPAAWLSNFACTLFRLDDVDCQSMEGFLQGLKEEKPEKQQRIFSKHGFEAKRAGTKARTNKAWESKSVWWRSQRIEYQSAAYFALVERALRAKFEQNEEAREALTATGNRPLIHDTGKFESMKTSLPAARFIEILMRVRAEYLGDTK